MELQPFEQLHDIRCGGLKLVQNTNGFPYGTDAVLLAESVILKKGDRVLDLCSGSGIIPLLLWSQGKAEKIIGIEIDEQVVKSAEKTVAINGLEGKLEFICGDIKNASKILKASYDVITCNPPYSKSGSGKVSDSKSIARARYELECTLEDVISSAAKVLRFGGRFYIVHKAERLADIIFNMRKYKIEPKEIKLVYTKKDKNAQLVIVCGVFGAGVQVNVLPPVIMGQGD